MPTFTPDDSTPRTAVPVDILRRLAFGRPQRRIQPALPAHSVAVTEAATPPPHEESGDLDQRVRQSGEW